MISIHRTFFFFRFCNRYFDKEVMPYNQGCIVTGYSHSLAEDARLEPVQTIHIQLQKSKETLFAEIEKENRRQIRKAEKRPMQFVALEQPTDLDLKKFQKFYNRHARKKNTYRCRSYNLYTLKKLTEKNGLVFTYMTDVEHKNTYCYRIYVTDGEKAMTLYSASNIDLLTSPETKRISSEANRYLIWKNILRFKERGVKVLDMGGLTDVPSIQKFKKGFGGNAVTVYSGYTASSPIGRLILVVRKRILNKGRGNDD